MSDLLAAARAVAENRWPLYESLSDTGYCHRGGKQDGFVAGVEWVLAKLDREMVARAIALGVDDTADYDACSVDYKDEMLAGADAVLALLGGDNA